MENFAADMVKAIAPAGSETLEFVDDRDTIEQLKEWGYTLVPLVRCFRCGLLMTEEQMTIDRIEPGAMGGRYTRDNIRPACGGEGGCNQSLGGYLGNERKKNR